MDDVFFPEWLRLGDPITIVAGAYVGYEGKVIDSLPEKRRLTVEIIVFGKKLVVELGYEEVSRP